MNIEEYISSGILEAYVLGDLTMEERAEVEKNLSVYPELREELLRIEETQQSFLMESAVQPRAIVKENLFKKIESKATEAKLVSMPSVDSQISFWKFAAAASVAIALVTSYLAYSYYTKWHNTENNLNELIAQNKRIASDYNTVNQRLEKIEGDVQVINNPSFNRVELKGTPNAPGSVAYVYWNNNTHEVYLSVQSLKELARENQYQLWAIVDGKPVDAGVFDLDFAGLLKMKEMDNAAAFAVTIEPRGGRPTPTLETMQVIGNVIKG